MISRCLAIVVVVVASFAPRVAPAGIISAASVPPDGSTLTVGDPLKITLSVDPTQISPSPAATPTANSAVFVLTLGFDVANVFNFVSESSSVPGDTFFGPIADPLDFSQSVTVTETIDRITDPSNPFIAPFDITLNFTAWAAHSGFITFTASIGTVYRDDEGKQIGSLNEDYESQSLVYTINRAGVPEPGSLTIATALLGLFGAARVRRRR